MNESHVVIKIIVHLRSLLIASNLPSFRSWGLSRLLSSSFITYIIAVRGSIVAVRGCVIHCGCLIIAVGFPIISIIFV